MSQMTWIILGRPYYQEIPGVLVKHYLFNWQWLICTELSVSDNLEENIILLNYVKLKDKKQFP